MPDHELNTKINSHYFTFSFLFLTNIFYDKFMTIAHRGAPVIKSIIEETLKESENHLVK